MELLFIANKTQYFKVISDTANIISIKWLFLYTELTRRVRKVKIQSLKHVQHF